MSASPSFNIRSARVAGEFSSAPVAQVFPQHPLRSSLSYTPKPDLNVYSLPYVMLPDCSTRHNKNLFAADKTVKPPEHVPATRNTVLSSEKNTDSGPDSLIICTPTARSVTGRSSSRHMCRYFSRGADLAPHLPAGIFSPSGTLAGSIVL